MTLREHRVTRMALSYMLSNLDDVCEAFCVEEDIECPNCHSGTLGIENDRLVCRGECGHDFGHKDDIVDYNGEIIPKPIEAEIECLMKNFE